MKEELKVFSLLSLSLSLSLCLCLSSIITYSVSSVLNNDTRQFGKKNLLDGRVDTCWNSDQVWMKKYSRAHTHTRTHTHTHAHTRTRPLSSLNSFYSAHRSLISYGLRPWSSEYVKCPKT